MLQKEQFEMLLKKEKEHLFAMPMPADNQPYVPSIGAKKSKRDLLWEEKKNKRETSQQGNPYQNVNKSFADPIELSIPPSYKPTTPITFLRKTENQNQHEEQNLQAKYNAPQYISKPNPPFNEIANEIPPDANPSYNMYNYNTNHNPQKIYEMIPKQQIALDPERSAVPNYLPPSDPKKQYLNELKLQMKEKELKSKEERLLKQQKERTELQQLIQNNPYGKVGAGAPLRDDGGNIITIRKKDISNYYANEANDPQANQYEKNMYLPQANQASQYPNPPPQSQYQVQQYNFEKLPNQMPQQKYVEIPQAPQQYKFNENSSFEHAPQQNIYQANTEERMHNQMQYEAPNEPQSYYPQPSQNKMNIDAPVLPNTQLPMLTMNAQPTAANYKSYPKQEKYDEEVIRFSKQMPSTEEAKRKAVALRNDLDAQVQLRAKQKEEEKRKKQEEELREEQRIKKQQQEIEENYKKEEEAKKKKANDVMKANEAMIAQSANKKQKKRIIDLPPPEELSKPNPMPNAYKNDEREIEEPIPKSKVNRNAVFGNEDDNNEPTKFEQPIKQASFNENYGDNAMKQGSQDQVNPEVEREMQKMKEEIQRNKSELKQQLSQIKEEAMEAISQKKKIEDDLEKIRAEIDKRKEEAKSYVKPQSRKGKIIPRDTTPSEYIPTISEKKSVDYDSIKPTDDPQLDVTLKATSKFIGFPQADPSKTIKMNPEINLSDIGENVGSPLKKAGEDNSFHKSSEKAVDTLEFLNKIAPHSVAQPLNSLSKANLELQNTKKSVEKPNETFASINTEYVEQINKINSQRMKDLDIASNASNTVKQHDELDKLDELIFDMLKKDTQSKQLPVKGQLDPIEEVDEKKGKDTINIEEFLKQDMDTFK